MRESRRRSRRCNKEAKITADHFYVVAYALRPMDTAIRRDLEDELTREQWSHFIPDVWVIGSADDTETLHQRLFRHLRPKRDSLLIVEITDQNRAQGWMPREMWEWWAKHIGHAGLESRIAATQEALR